MLGVPWVKSSDTHDAPKCNGRRDWLAGNNAAKEECDHRMVHRQVGNTSVTMNEGGSIMIIPPYTGWDFVDAAMMFRLQQMSSLEDFRQMWYDDVQRGHPSLTLPIEKLRGTSYERENGEIDHESITQRLWAYHQQNWDEILTLSNLRRRERMGLVSDDSGQYSETQFAASVVAGGLEELPDGWRNPHGRQIRQIKFTGLRNYATSTVFVVWKPMEVPNRWTFLNIARLHLRSNLQIGMYNYGEGLYFDIKPEWLQNQVDKRSKLSPAHRNMDLAFERLMPSMIQQLPFAGKGKSKWFYRSPYVQPLLDQGAGSNERVLSGVNQRTFVLLL